VKKVLLLVSALLIVFSGVAAVSAYEGHMVDVKAHVENALIVNPTDEVGFGTVFPQEKLESQVYVSLSESFISQGRYSSVEYKVYWEPKPVADHQVCTNMSDGTFIPIYPYIDVKIDGVTINASSYIDMGNGVMFVGLYDLDIASDRCDVIHLILDPPVAAKYYNPLTDPRDATDPPNVLPDDAWCWVMETSNCTDIDGNPLQALVPHLDLGSNLKIQVTNCIGE